MHCFVQAANLSVLLSLLILVKALLTFSPNSVALIPCWSWYGLCCFDGLVSSLFKFGLHVIHVKACHIAIPYCFIMISADTS